MLPHERSGYKGPKCDSRVLCNKDTQTPSGSEGSSGSEFLFMCAGLPGYLFIRFFPAFLQCRVLPCSCPESPSPTFCRGHRPARGGTHPEKRPGPGQSPPRPHLQWRARHGKTTLARIMAKALNCSGRQGVEPCNECQSCREIATGWFCLVLRIFFS